MAPRRMQDSWAVGHEYDLYLGRGSRTAARRFLDWLEAPAGADWLEVGVGTGVLTQAVLETCAPRSVTAVDADPYLAGTPREHLTNPRLRVRRAEPEQLPVPDAGFDVAVSVLVPGSRQEPARALAELRRAVRPGGLVAAYVWDYAGRMDLIHIFWEAAAALDPAAAETAEAVRAAGVTTEALAGLWDGAGLEAVEPHAINVSTVFPNFETFWRPFLGGDGAAPTYCVSLAKPQREALRRRISDALPIQEDGSINLISRLLVVKGVAP